jgi:hypothetical protein
VPAVNDDPLVHPDLFPAAKYLQPLGRGFMSQAINFDGILTCERSADDFTAYAQGFWDGRIEMVDALLLSPRADGRKQVPTRALEDSLIRTLDLSRLYYEELEMPPPCFFGLALLGVRGYRLAVDETLWSEMTNHAVERTDLIFPEVTIREIGAPSTKLLRPLFDLLWNACGFQRCLDYDSTGAWRPSA